MSAGKGGGLLNRLVISPLVFLTLFFTGCYFVLGGPATSAIGRTATTALGYGAGTVLGNLGTLAENLKLGQSAAGGTPPSALVAGPNQSAPKAEAKPKADKPAAKDSTGNRSNDGTDAIR